MIEVVEPRLWVPKYPLLHILCLKAPPTVALPGREWYLYGDEMGNPTLDEQAGWFCYAFLAVRADFHELYKKALKEAFWATTEKPPTIQALQQALAPTKARVVVSYLNLKHPDIRERLKAHWEARRLDARSRLGEQAPTNANLIWMQAFLAAYLEVVRQGPNIEVMEKIHVRYDQKSLKSREYEILQREFSERLPQVFPMFLGEGPIPRAASFKDAGDKNPFIRVADRIVREAYEQLRNTDQTSLPRWIQCMDSTFGLESILRNRSA